MSWLYDLSKFYLILDTYHKKSLCLFFSGYIQKFCISTCKPSVNLACIICPTSYIISSGTPLIKIALVSLSMFAAVLPTKTIKFTFRPDYKLNVFYEQSIETVIILIQDNFTIKFCTRFNR